MAAAVSAKEQGVEKVILLERHGYLGGVLPQCIHNGFGTQLYRKDYTGGEYAWLWKQKTEEAGVEVYLNTTVLSIEKGWRVKCVSAQMGAKEWKADAIVIATGCRERTLPQMLIPSSRPAGIFTAGTAQQMMNLKNYLPGKSAVIFGSGDIGLIMARRMTLEGIQVKLILGQKATGLARNRIQCVEDYEIPMRYGWTVVSTHGYQRLKGVSIAPFDEEGKPDLSQKQYIACDTLLVATGLIPELEVCGSFSEAESKGIFFCGNAKKVHDLVDHVTEEGILVGRKAAAFLGHGHFNEVKQKIEAQEKHKTGNMICTVCPKSCVMQVEKDPFTVLGNQCEKGDNFARQEIMNPQRVVTSIVKAGNGTVSVRTNHMIEKTKVFDVMEAIKKVHIQLPVVPGQIIAKNIAATGADLVATWYAEEK